MKIQFESNLDYQDRAICFRVDIFEGQVVFKDKSFADTNVKTNAIQVLKQYDIDEVVSA